jgi:hypothetical protein
MRKLLCLITCFFTISTSFAYVSSGINYGDEAALIGISLKNNGDSNLYFSIATKAGEDAEQIGYNKSSFIENRVSYSLREKQIATSLMLRSYQQSFTQDITTTINDKFNYSGYENVEGYHNTGKSQDRTFAGLAIGTFALVVVGGTVAVVALVGAASN